MEELQCAVGLLGSPWDFCIRFWLILDCACVCCNPANYAPEMRFYSELDLFIVILCLILACGTNWFDSTSFFCLKLYLILVHGCWRLSLSLRIHKSGDGSIRQRYYERKDTYCILSFWIFYHHHKRTIEHCTFFFRLHWSCTWLCFPSYVVTSELSDERSTNLRALHLAVLHL